MAFILCTYVLKENCVSISYLLYWSNPPNHVWHQVSVVLQALMSSLEAEGEQ